jgi:hypothetical protein
LAIWASQLREAAYFRGLPRFANEILASIGGLAKQFGLPKGFHRLCPLGMVRAAEVRIIKGPSKASQGSSWRPGDLSSGFR